jgi:hypothetical protein
MLPRTTSLSPGRQRGSQATDEGIEGVVVAQQRTEGPDAAFAVKAGDDWRSGHGGAAGNMKKAARRLGRPPFSYF